MMSPPHTHVHTHLCPRLLDLHCLDLLVSRAVTGVAGALYICSL